MKRKLILISILSVSLILLLFTLSPEIRWEIGKTLQIKSGTTPTIKDPNVIIEEVVVGVNDVSSFDFLSENELLFLEKSKGDVRLIKNGILQDKPIYKFQNVSSSVESGLLGIVISQNDVYIYVTELNSLTGDTQNNIYKFQWDGEKLINKQLVTILPANSCCHHGGYMIKDNDNNILAVIGDLEKVRHSGIVGPLQNAKTGELDDTSAIIIVEHEKDVLYPSKSKNPTNHYFAIGIRNSFGMAIDPLNGNLWDTENGQNSNDEINLVNPKFNSGWAVVQGLAKANSINLIPKFENFEYSDPEFSWEKVVAPTGIAFAGELWGEKYENSIFVGDYIYGNLYKFELNSSRDAFIFKNDELKDLVLNADDNPDEIIFGHSFGRISDIKFSSDGSLYVATHLNNGAIFKLKLND